MIPFDNLRFAPSAGWAAVSPYLFLAAAGLLILLRPQMIGTAYRAVPSRVVVLAVVLGFTSLVSYIFVPVDLRLVALTAIKLLLGFAFFFCLTAFSGASSDWLRSTARALVFGYSLALLMGVSQWLRIYGFLDFSIGELFFARNYPHKIQYTFTEPSFASLHAFGVVALFSLLFLNQPGRRGQILLTMPIIFVLMSALSASSLRILVDSAIIGTAVVLLAPRRVAFRFLGVFVAVILVLVSALPATLWDRIERIQTAQNISDPSAVIRKFRAEAALYGAAHDPYTALFGFGFGNSGEAMRVGFSAAEEGVAFRLKELEQLRDDPDGLTYSLHAKIITEHGVLGYVLFLVLLFSRRHKIAYALMVVAYLQFDSYSFYTLWLYLYLVSAGKGLDTELVRYFFPSVKYPLHNRALSQ